MMKKQIIFLFILVPAALHACWPFETSDTPKTFEQLLKKDRVTTLIVLHQIHSKNSEKQPDITLNRIQLASAARVGIETKLKLPNNSPWMPLLVKHAGTKSLKDAVTQCSCWEQSVECYTKMSTQDYNTIAQHYWATPPDKRAALLGLAEKK